MMGLDPAWLRTLQKAHGLGLGEYDLRTIEVIGELRRLPDFKLPPLGGEANLDDAHLQQLVHERTLLRPRTDEKLCTGCATCVNQCPVSALSLVDAIPQVDAAVCIGCFCCQELCPEKAIVLR
jgi:Pyruvate/2-oxoacid:ferredoxin oxidoreductase delta subunit